MTRSEFAWLVVRAVGAFLLLLIALDLITILLTSIQAVSLHSEIMSDPFAQDDVTTRSIRYGRLIERIWYLGIEVVVQALFAYYCFFRGTWIHKLLIGRLPAAEQS